jgi:asparagine synthase (glutamine-hydrolysing)
VGAHRRLKIIDLSEHAQQPMVRFDMRTRPDAGLQRLHLQLPRTARGTAGPLGYRFNSSGDTEVVLKAFHAWGEACVVTRLHGMFAFAVHERDSGRVVLARDRFGIKPLYLAPIGRWRPALCLHPAGPARRRRRGHARSTCDALDHYLSWHAVVPPPLTLLRGVRKLPPATLTAHRGDGRAPTPAGGR